MLNVGMLGLLHLLRVFRLCFHEITFATVGRQHIRESKYTVVPEMTGFVVALQSLAALNCGMVCPQHEPPAVASETQRLIQLHWNGNVSTAWDQKSETLAVLMSNHSACFLCTKLLVSLRCWRSKSLMQISRPSQLQSEASI